MPRFVVLLRGVNVGKANRVPMSEFASMLRGLGYTDVVTLLNSGNAVFTSSGRSSAGHARNIARALGERFGVGVATVVRSGAQLAAAVAANPLPVPEGDHSRFLVAFANDVAALQGLEPLQGMVRPPERFAIGQQAAYLYCAAGILESKAGVALTGTLGRSVTTRNWATTLKLASLCGANAPAARDQ